MKYFIFIFSLFLHAFINAKTLYYKNVNTYEKESDIMRVEFPEDCLEIIEISNDKSLEFKNNYTIEKILSECNALIKEKRVKDTFKSRSDKAIDKGIKVKEGIQKGLKSGVDSISNSVSKETNFLIEDTVKLKDNIVVGTSKIIDSTLEKGNKITSGVSSFLKDIFNSRN